MSIEYADISSWQGTVNWTQYKAWSSMVAMKATEGTGFTDPRYRANRTGAEAVGLRIVHYHFARPDLNGAQAEATWFFQVVGNVGDGLIMLDYEQNTPAATAEWAYEWLSKAAQLFGQTPTIYASTSFVQTHLQGEPRLSQFPLILANWTYDPAARPACPTPWTSYLAIQYTDKASVPGISGAVDANVWLGPAPTTGGTVSELLNFPFVNQRTDGDLNHDFDCVPSSLEAGANYLLGKPVINDAAMKDAIYGAGYVGGTAASAYVDYLKARGVHIYPIDGAYPDLIKQAHQHLAAGHPVVFTRDDPYSSNPADSHVCVWYKDTATSLTCMDPFGAHAITMTDTVWEQHLRFNEIWIMEKAMLTINDSHYFTDLGNSVWKCTNGNLLGHGMLNYYCTTGVSPLFGLTLYGLPLTGEIAIPGHAGVVLQVFERGVLCYDPGHVIDNPPGSGSVYAMHLDKGDALTQLAKFMPTQPAPVDTTQAVADVQAIADAVGQAAGAAIAKAVLTIQKL